MNDMSARDEWAASWPLPFVAMLGVAGSATFAFSSGVFLAPMTAEFGWSRAQFSSAFLLQMIVLLVAMPMVGRLVDRFGPRRIALSGIGMAAVGLASLGWVNTGSLFVWAAACAVQAGLTVAVTPPVWITPLALRFDRSRGLALALGLAGVGVAIAIWPVLAALAVQTVGWRWAFVLLALYWPVLMLPLTLFLFRVGPARRHPPVSTTGEAFRYLPVLRSRTFVCITAAGALFAIASFGLTANLVPILRGEGISLTAAAGIAGLTGIASIAGRVGTGFLLDRLPTRLIGTAIFVLPIVVGALLWQGSTDAAIVAVVVLGLAAGAETDVVVYLAARHFAGSGFATIYAVASAVFGVCAAIGPLTAGIIFDRTGAYTGFFILIAPLVVGATTMLWCVPKLPGNGATDAAPTPSTAAVVA
ncbi:MFS transporter [uncultured Sphingomonas sp.]|uniref:MFS transporter n=1 Tax=uncultured Sphingomonas sp. TaxID=158754 RepID=UPI00261FD033|nr:MFS transporter [uncultured Sphingomonas sp.]